MAEESHDLSGNLATFPITELVQFLHAGRRSGRLELLQPNGHRAHCLVVEGGLSEAQEEHLRDREALLSMMAWRAGRFFFDVGAAPSASAASALSVPALVMEFARLEDELERLSADAPAPHAKLTLRDKTILPEDPLECGVQAVFAAIGAKPQVRLPELDQLLDLAPIKIRLSASWMMSQGLLGSRVSQTFSPLQFDPSSNQWYVQLLLEHPTGLRVLVVSPPNKSSDDLVAMVQRVAADLRGTPSISAAVDGPSIVRIRPAAGGLLSFTFLPLKKKHRFLFQTFARTAQLVLMPEQGDATDMAEWDSDAPLHIPRIRFDDTSPTALLEALQTHAGNRARKRARQP